MERKIETYTQICCLAKSLAGHDRDRYYAVIGEDEAGYLLADGVHALLGKPKYKKKIHVQIVRKLATEIIELLANAKSDDEVSKTITLYENRI